MKILLLVMMVLSCIGCSRGKPHELVLQQLKESKIGIIRYSMSDSKLENNPDFYDMMEFVLRDGKVLDMGYPWHEGIMGFALVFDSNNRIVLSGYIRDVNMTDIESTDIYFCSPRYNTTVVIPRRRAAVVFDEVKRTSAPNRSPTASP